MTREELEKYELYKMFDEYLNFNYELINICGYEYEPAYAFKLVDKIAYNVEFYNWLDLMVTDGNITCIDDKYYKEF